MEHANNIRAAVKASGYTQRELADKIGLSYAGIHHLITSADPKLSTLRRLADALNVPLSELVT